MSLPVAQSAMGADDAQVKQVNHSSTLVFAGAHAEPVYGRYRCFTLANATASIIAGLSELIKSGISHQCAQAPSFYLEDRAVHWRNQIIHSQLIVVIIDRSDDAPLPKTLACTYGITEFCCRKQHAEQHPRRKIILASLQSPTCPRSRDIIQTYPRCSSRFYRASAVSRMDTLLKASAPYLYEVHGTSLLKL